MTGYLALDRDALRLLAAAADRAVTDLRRLSPWDPAAAREHSEVLRAVRLIGDWTSCLASLSGCGVLESYRAIAPSGGDLERAVWLRLASAVHMQLVADPWAGLVDARADVDPFLRGASLADALGDDDIDELLTDDQLRWLDGELTAVLATPAGRRGFVDRIGTDALGELLTRLAERQAELDAARWPAPDEHARSTAAIISRLFGTIGGAVGRRHESGGSVDVAGVAAQLPPAAAAQLIAGARLSGADLAALAHDVLARWWTAVEAPSSTAAWARAPGDILLPLVAADPVASWRLVDLVLDRPELLFRTSRDSTAAGQIVVHATDPHTVGVDDAGRIVPRLLDHLRLEDEWLPGFAPGPGADRSWLGTVAGAWLLEISDPPPSWGWSLTQAETALRFVLDDEGALALVTSRATERLRDVAARLPADRAAAQAALEDLSRLVGQLDTLVMQAHLSDAEAARALWDLGWAVAGVVAVGALGAIDLPAGVAVGIATEAGEAGPAAAVGGAQSLIEHIGILPVPPPRESVRHDLLAERDEGRAMQAAAVVDVVFATMVTGGLVPRSVSAPPQPAAPGDGSQRTVSEAYLDSFHDWRDGLVAAGHLDQDDADDLTLALHTMLNPAQAAALGAEIRTTG